MKKLNRYLLSLIVLTVLLSVSFLTNEKASAQGKVTVTLKTPPPGQFHVEDMWKVTVSNTSKETYVVYFYGTLTEKKAGMIANATTDVKSIKPGVTNLKASDFPKQPDVSYSGDPKYKDALIKTGSLLPGEYTYCIYAKLKKDNQEMGSDCIDQIIEETGMISLTLPNNEDEISPNTPVVFSWMSSNPKPGVKYLIKVVELTEGQSPIVAFEKNKAFFEKDNLTSTIFNYPTSAAKFLAGKKYVWRVSQGIIKSEISSFGVMETLKDSTCGCGSWENIQMTKNNTPPAINVQSGVPINVTTPTNLSFNPHYYCNPNDTICRTIYTWYLTKTGSGLISGSNNTIPCDFGITSAGTYYLSIVPFCNGIKCDSTVLTISTGDSCHADSLLLNTGINRANSNAKITPGLADNFWKIRDDPYTGTIEPRQAIVLLGQTSWGSLNVLPNSQWISFHPNATNECYASATQVCEFIFESKFCLDSGFTNPELTISNLLVDDDACVFLNGNPVNCSNCGTSGNCTPIHSATCTNNNTCNFYLANSHSFYTNTSSDFHAGANYLRVVVTNRYGQLLGLNIQGKIKANGLSVEKQVCCDSTGSIEGHKWNDVNGNCRKDNGELPLGGFTINLDSASTLR